MKRLVKTNRNKSRQIRRQRVRVSGTAATPRLSVFRGLRSLVAQLIDDQKGKTLCFVKSGDLKSDKVEGKSGKVALAYLVGKSLAEKAVAMGVKEAVFDRGGYQYHGRVQAVADGARDGGLKF